MKKGFDNDKYLAMQSEHIRERIQQIIMHPVYFRDLSQTANCVCSCSWQIRWRL